VTDNDTHNPQRYLGHAATSDRLSSDREETVLTEFLNDKEKDFHRHDGRNGTPSKNNIVYNEVELSHAVYVDASTPSSSTEVRSSISLR
jgi:hypothetical protein